MIQNKTESKTLTAKQLKAIPIILAAASLDAAAKKAAIGRETIYRWLKQKHFRERLEQKRQELFEEGLNRLKAATDLAAVKMIEMLDSKDENTRRLVAKDILNFALKAVEAQDLEERIERIEEIIDKRFIS